MSPSRTAEGFSASLITEAYRPERPLPTQTAAAATLANNSVKSWLSLVQSKSRMLSKSMRHKKKVYEATV